MAGSVTAIAAACCRVRVGLSVRPQTVSVAIRSREDPCASDAIKVPGPASERWASQCVFKLGHFSVITR